MTTKPQNSFPRAPAFMLPAWLVMLLTISGANVCAQNANAPAAPVAVEGEPPASQAGEGGTGLQLLRILNLSPEQREQIGSIRRETAPQARLLNQRLRQARRALDEVIYLNNADESLVEQRSREFAAAQAAVVRFRSLSELKIRRVLTPEQLNAFRDLQRQARTRLRNRRQAEGSFPGGSDNNSGDDAARRRRQRIERRRERQQTSPPPNSPPNNPNNTSTPNPRGERRRNPLRRARLLKP